MRYLHCSDVHITADYARLDFLRLGWRRWIAYAELTVGGRAKRYARAQETLAQIAREAQAVEHCIVSGDLTAYALDWEFEHAQRALGAMTSDPLRCTVIPGNHDRYTPGALRNRRYEKYFGQLTKSDLPSYAVEDGFPFVRLLGERDAVVGLCSARVPAVPGLSYGVVGEAQLTALERLLKDPSLKDRAVLVVVHHAPFKENGKPDRLLHGLRDARRLLSLIPGDRYALLHGHIHHRYHHPATTTQPHIFGAGSSTELGHEGYWRIETRDGRVVGGTQQPVQRNWGQPES